MKKILFVDNGVEFDSITLRKKPHGGAEVAFVSLVESLAKLDYEVVVYNNCVNEGKINKVNWKKINDDIYLENFDTLVINRGDKFLNFKRECKNRIFWIHNPATYLIKYRYLSKLFFNKTKIIFSSNFHLNSYPKWAPASERIIIPYGIDDYLFKKKIEQNSSNRNAIFTSNPMRGLDWLLDKWEKEIYPHCHGSKLEIYSGFQTYGKFGIKHSKKIRDILSKAQSLKDKGVILNDPIERKELFKKIIKSRVFIYKGSDDETFCMAVAEAQMLGVPAVVRNYGCMRERIINGKTGFLCESDEDFCSKTIKILNDNKTLKKMKGELNKKKNYHSWLEIARKWQEFLN